MAQSKLPGSDAARHGTGHVDLRVMMASHDAFRRDLTKLARTAKRSNLSDPTRLESILAGWTVFKRQLLQHHEGEDEFLWPNMRERMTDSEFAMSTLDAMEHEHELIDPLLAAVDTAFADSEAGDQRLADVIDDLTTNLLQHLTHEERDTLPMIGVALNMEEWQQVLEQIRAKGGVASAVEMIPWLLNETTPETAAGVLDPLPPQIQQLYQTQWKPQYDAVNRW
jgi:iron-sulfur cluster repair protein YtfE (RIC family)